ncbi:hypothetical protein Acsp03_61250 [Actinomadura sp. NBRC 104412]|nr:hypothetical protein Acsp03_61250 [Actinomadura sp. NBRC 104412]
MADGRTFGSGSGARVTGAGLGGTYSPRVGCVSGGAFGVEGVTVRTAWGLGSGSVPPTTKITPTATATRTAPATTNPHLDREPPRAITDRSVPTPRQPGLDPLAHAR